MDRILNITTFFIIIQSPGKPQQQQQQQDTFLRTSAGQTPQHSGMSEEPNFTPGHDPFEHMTPGPSQTEKTSSNEMSALGVASLDGAISMLPQPGDSEEKLRQVYVLIY